MQGIATKRIVKDLDILNKNQEDLKKRGIYYHIDADDITHMDILICPRDKREGALISPYTGGFFLFKMTFGNDFPMSPPKLEFNPKQQFCRLHPNYYEGGKVCLSVINTWAKNDWTPATSIMSLINVLEERFNENAICFEPSFEMASNAVKMNYNKAVEYAKYKVCILDVFKLKSFDIFKDDIQNEFQNNKDYLINRLKELRDQYGNKTVASTPCYGYHITCDYDLIITKLENI